MRWLFVLTILPVLLIDFPKCATKERRLFGLFYTFRQENKTFYRVKNDPNQVKPDFPTRENMFYWLNLKNNVKFRLWTRKNPDLAHEIKYNDTQSFLTSNFDKRKLTKVIIHGYLDGANEIHIGGWMFTMRDKYLQLADVNVVVVDYSLYAFAAPFYFSARPETVGKRVAEMIKFLVSLGVPLKSFHLIGWSWGAQVAGIAGHELKGKLRRITGLDPAGPGFRFLDNEFRLDKSDAEFVDVFHTAAGTRLFTGGHFSIFDALGHVDVYFNGGERQAGCPRHRSYSFETLWCNHGRAPAYYIETITSPLAFPTCPCGNLDEYIRGICSCDESLISYIGEHLPHSTRGTFQVITRTGKPYGLGPEMNITLSGIQFTRKDISSTMVPIPNQTAVVEFKKKKYRILSNNSYSVKDFKSNYIFRIAKLVLDESKKRENFA